MKRKRRTKIIVSKLDRSYNWQYWKFLMPRRFNFGKMHGGDTLPIYIH
jgi:hypothetical protein